MKKDKIRFYSQYSQLDFDLIPGEKGDAKMAYVRIGTDDEMFGSLDNSNMRRLKKVHRWLTEIIAANK